MNTKISKKIIAISFLCTLLFSGGVIASELSEEQEAMFDQLRQAESREWEQKRHETQLEEIKQKISDNFETYEETGKSVEEYEKILASLRVKVLTIEGQIKNIETQIKISEERIQQTKFSIEKKKIDIAQIMDKINYAKTELATQHTLVNNYIRYLWEEEQKYRATGEQDLSLIRLMLADTSTFSNAMRSIDYFEIVEKSQRKIFQKLEITNNELQLQELKLREEKAKLAKLNSIQRKQLQTLEVEKASKQSLLAQTEGEEEKYQQLLEESYAQQLESYREILHLRDNKQFIEDQLKIFENETLFQQVRSVLSDQFNKDSDPYDLSKISDDSFFKVLSWPVTPSLGLSAHFDDNNYKNIYRVDHHAIDIPVYQGTAIRAPANGYVVKVVDNGLGYSYMIIAHAGGLSTLFGHMSGFAVEQGALVHRGDVIGYTGGQPGTKGAGMRTTGPHLHFETHLNGKRMDPLQFLPLSELPTNRLSKDILEMIRKSQ